MHILQDCRGPGDIYRSDQYYGGDTESAVHKCGVCGVLECGYLHANIRTYIHNKKDIYTLQNMQNRHNFVIYYFMHLHACKSLHVCKHTIYV